MNRKEALSQLARFGITGPDVYLIDVFPLIDMMWADGKMQPVERRLLDEFLVTHVENFNRMAGSEVLTVERARTFAAKHLETRPDANVLRMLMKLIPTVRWENTSDNTNRMQRQRVLDWCLDIAASSVSDYPYGDHERFSAAEKACYERILDALLP